MAFTSKLATSDSLLSNLTLGGDVITPIIASTSNAITFSQSVSYNLSAVKSVSSVFTISQAVKGFVPQKRLQQTFVISQSLTSNFSYVRALSDTLTFSNVSSFVQIRTTANTLTFSQSVLESMTKGAVNTLALSQSLALEWIHTENLFQSFSITQSVEATRVLTLPVSSTLDFNQNAEAVRSRPFALTSILPLGQGLSAVTILQASSVLILSQNVTVARTTFQAVNNNLALTQDLARTVVYNRQLVSNLIFQHTHPRTLPNGDVTYVPDVIHSFPKPSVILQVPARAITLHVPDFGDKEGGLGEVITQKTINGATYTYIRKTGLRKLTYSFSISRPKAQELRSYILNYLSEPMKLTNWKGEIWFGYLTNNPFTLTARRRAMPCDEEESEIELEFEGIRIH